jgi:hypothetical protein
MTKRHVPGTRDWRLGRVSNSTCVSSSESGSMSLQYDASDGRR